jgi:extracellular matrix regulatory protein B
LFLHLGNDRVIAGHRVIAILNIEDMPSAAAEGLMATARLDRPVEYIDNRKKKKALVLCDDQVYISPISSHTLYKRALQGLEEV